jgi:hypothetical protein
MKAFPVGNSERVWDEGMDLRDYFAALAMQGLLSNVDIVKTHMENAVITDIKPTDILCKEAYFIADAMMTAREKK